MLIHKTNNTFHRIEILKSLSSDQKEMKLKIGKRKKLRKLADM